jgi:phage portal protein BeeE
MAIGFIKFTLQRHLVKFEQEINRKVFRTDRNFCEFETSGLERGDTKTRNESYRIALGRAGEPGWMTVNEVRKRENLPPVEGGDDIATAAPPAPDPESDPASDPEDDPAGSPNQDPAE